MGTLGRCLSPKPKSPPVAPTFALVILQAVAGRTDAAVGPIQVLAGAWGTFLRVEETFIDICREKGKKKEEDLTGLNSI